MKRRETGSCLLRFAAEIKTRRGDIPASPIPLRGATAARSVLRVLLSLLCYKISVAVSNMLPRTQVM